MSNTTSEHADIAVLGSGPAGMQAALVTSRTGRMIVVFDDPQPSRNAASHGVHNFLGLESLLASHIASHSVPSRLRHRAAVLTLTLGAHNAGALLGCPSMGSEGIPL